MKLVLEATGADVPPAIADFKLPAGDSRLSASAKLETARRILFDATYSANVDLIMEPTKLFEAALDARTKAAVAAAESARGFARNILIALAVLIPLAWPRSSGSSTRRSRA